MTPSQDRVLGCFLGVATGDALGLPLETYDPALIAERHGRVTQYLPCVGNTYYGDAATGSTSDDWQLTRAVAEGILQGDGLDMEAVSICHIQTAKESLRGWGPTTREAIERLAAGVHWNACGKTNLPNRGIGNGVCMKTAPVGVYLALTNPSLSEPGRSAAIHFLADLARLTHWSSMGVQSGLCQAFAIWHCLLADPATFSTTSFIETVVAAATLGRQFLPETIGKDDLAERLKLLSRHEEYDSGRIMRELRGTSYVYESLPFTYMFFVKNAHSIEALYDCVSAGGDTDSNGSMLASLLGALHGASIFPAHLVDELPCRETVMAVANRFWQFVKRPGI